MALSTTCRLGLALVAAVSAGHSDWESFARHYAGDFYHGPTNGEFAGHLQEGKQHSSGLVDEYASQHSQDRVSEAREDAKAFSQERLKSAEEAARQFSQQGSKQAADLDKQAAGFDPMMRGATALAAVPAAAESQSQGVTPAEDSEAAVHRAEAGLHELREWDAKLKADLEDKNFSAKVARSIVSKVQASNVLQRAELESKFDAAVKAMSKADNRSELSAAEQSAQRHSEELSHLDDQERKAMRKTLNSIEKQGKRKTRALWKQVREAAHQAYHLGMGAARAQRRAGVAEHIYEHAMGEAEKVSERLSGRAEHLAEHAEDLVERQSGAVEHHLEKSMDRLQDASHHEREQRLRQTAQQAKDVKQRGETSKGSTDQKASSSPDSHQTSTAKEDKSSEKDKRSPATFLANVEPAGFSGAPVAAGALAVLFMSAALVLRVRRDEQTVAPPLLG